MTDEQLGSLIVSCMADSTDVDDETLHHWRKNAGLDGFSIDNGILNLGDDSFYGYPIDIKKFRELFQSKVSFN